MVNNGGITIIVCGGREYSDRNRVYATLDKILAKTDDLIVIHGAAKGADQLAQQWCVDRKVWQMAFPANWSLHGKAAGPIRNEIMLKELLQSKEIKGRKVAVVAFPGGRGTQDMINRASAAQIVVHEVMP